MAVPLVEISGGTGSGTLPNELIAKLKSIDPAQMELTSMARPTRKLAIYDAAAGFDLLPELDFLSARAIEPNVFFNPRFLAPAMPRLEDREVRLAVIRDEAEERSRLRLLVPFTVEKPAVPLAVPVLRTWSNHFGPLGTPLIDHDDPVGFMEDFFSMLAQPQLKFPKVFVLPETRTDGPFAAALRAVAEARNLPLLLTGETERAFLQSDLDGDSYLRDTLSSHHFREFRRLKRRLEAVGTLEYRIARRPDDIRIGVEAFLSLEAAGWKGRHRTAMVMDRYQAAFAREATNLLAERDQCRIHSLVLDGRPIAVLIVLLASGVAYTWKTTFDETYSQYSPGTLLMIETTKSHLDDPNILETDSCAVPDHPVMSRLWSERRPLGTFVIGLLPGSERHVHQAASQLAFYRETKSALRTLRNKVRRFLRYK